MTGVWEVYHLQDGKREIIENWELRIENYVERGGQ